MDSRRQRVWMNAWKNLHLTVASIYYECELKVETLWNGIRISFLFMVVISSSCYLIKLDDTMCLLVFLFRCENSYLWSGHTHTYTWTLLCVGLSSYRTRENLMIVSLWVFLFSLILWKLSKRISHWYQQIDIFYGCKSHTLSLYKMYCVLRATNILEFIERVTKDIFGTIDEVNHTSSAVVAAAAACDTHTTTCLCTVYVHHYYHHTIN